MKIEERILAIKKSEPLRKNTIGVYHASMIYDIVKGYMTPKKFLAEPTYPDDNLLLIFELGNMYHDYVQKYYKPHEKEVRVQIVEPDFTIRGRIDLLLDGQTPVELKTCTFLPKNYSKAHECQLMFYLKALNRDFGYLTYIEKNPKTFITKNFKIGFNEKLYNEYLEKVRFFDSKLKTQLPKVEKMSKDTR